MGKSKYGLFSRFSKIRSIALTLLMQLSAIISLVNVIVLLGLLVIYTKGMRRVRSGFTLGLVLFAAFLLVQNLVGVFSYAMMESNFDASLAPFMLSISSAELLGLAILLGATLR